jgi:MoaA/NifB/PqqE/SkfB family radical SAM enzyme
VTRAGGTRAGAVEVARRSLGRSTGRLWSVPILALSVHSACNCRCVMCDIWKANANRREISAADLDRHLDSIRRLRVRRVMLTGGEPLLHTNLWALCERLKTLRIRVTLVTTGLALARHAPAAAAFCDDVVVSVDGDRKTHDAIRRVPGAFDRVAAGIAALRAASARLPISARTVVQRQNHRDLRAIVRAARELAVDRISFLAADVSSGAFNRPEPWDEARKQEVMLTGDDLPVLKLAIEQLIGAHGDDIRAGFIENSAASLRRIHEYYAALSGGGHYPVTRCNAPWVSAVVEPDGIVRPCFFHAPYGRIEDGTGLADVLNSPSAVAFRRGLDVATDETCRRCVCSLNLPVWRRSG